MNENMVLISKDEYKSILELAYKAAMLKEAVLNGASFDRYSHELYFGGCREVSTIIKYAFPHEYESTVRKLTDKNTQDMKDVSDDER